MESIMNYLKDHLIMTIVIGSLIIITIYTVFAVFLNKLNNAKHGKTTILAWIPGFNIFLLGKLVVHWTIGLLLFIALLFGICISFNIPELESIKSLMPQEYVLVYQIAYGVIILILLIVGKIKLNRLIREGNSKAEMSAFVNRDYNEKEPEIVVEKKQEIINENKPVEIEEKKDDFYGSFSPLSKLNNNTHDSNNKNPN